jgi:hypothetical protein
MEWFKWGKQRLGNVALLPGYMTNASWILGPFLRYMKGDITLQAFLKQVNAKRVYQQLNGNASMP